MDQQNEIGNSSNTGAAETSKQHSSSVDHQNESSHTSHTGASNSSELQSSSGNHQSGHTPSMADTHGQVLDIQAEEARRWNCEQMLMFNGKMQRWKYGGSARRW